MGRLLPKTGEGFFNICLASSYEISDIRMICRKCPDLQSTPSTQATPNSTISSPQESNHGFLDTSSLYLKESSQVHRSRIGGDTIGCLCVYILYIVLQLLVYIYIWTCMYAYIYIYISLWKQSTCQRSVHSTKKNCSLVPPFGPSQWPQVHVLSAPCNAGVSAKHHKTSTISNWTFQWLRQILQKNISV